MPSESSTLDTHPKKSYRNTILNITAFILLGWVVVYVPILLDAYFKPYSQLTTDDIWNLQNFISNAFAVLVPLVIAILIFLRGKRFAVRVLFSIFISLTLFIILAVSSVSGTFNSLVAVDQDLNEQAANLRASYQLRLELIPSLLEVAREPLAQESEIQLGLTSAREKFAESQNIESTVESANQIESQLKKILLLVEAYPTLRQTTEYQYLQKQMSDTAVKLNTQREKYNAVIKTYNLTVLSFPMRIFANMFGFEEHPYWDELASFTSVPESN